MNAKTYTEPWSGRPWQLSAVSNFEGLADAFVGPGADFVLLIAADTTGVPWEQLVSVCQRLLKSGVVYACTWGPGAARLESAFDEAAVHPGDRRDGILMTTSHENESLEQAAWFAAHTAYPDEAYSDGAAGVAFVAVENEDWYERLATYLAAGAPTPDEA